MIGVGRPGHAGLVVGDDPRALEERFHQLVDAVSDYAIFLLDPTGHVTTWNVGARKIKGYEEAEIVGRHFSVFYPDEDRAAGRPEQILDVVRREGRYEEEGWRVRKDGTRFWADVVITSLRNDEGEVIGFAKITRDLTERRTSAEQLRQSEERFRLLVEGVLDYAIYMLDPEGRITTWNVGAQRMKGYAPDEILGRHFSIFFPEEDQRAGKPARELERALADGRFEDEAWRKRKDGTLFWANVIVTPVRGAHGELVGFAKVTRDLSARRDLEKTERRLMREQLARAAAEENERLLREGEEAARRAALRAAEEARRAEYAARVKDEFLATVSHELRTPLNAILGYASLLRAHPGGRLDPGLVKAVDVIHRNAQAQARIIDDILDVSRIVTGKLRLELKALDLVAVVKEAIDVVRTSADAKHIALDLVAKADPALLIGDPERLRQVVWNLLSNAVKFTPNGGTVTVTIEQEGSAIALAVEDTGSGIDAAVLPHVFERFMQADSSTTRKFGGLGLGLAIVRHLVELHGGQVNAESAGIGKGSRFSLVLPVRAVAPAEAEDERAAKGPAEARTRPATALDGVRVLVVDDDEDARDLLRIALSRARAEVVTVDSVRAALEAIARARPDVVVSDVGMPGEDGYELARRLAGLAAGGDRPIPAIALTAYTRAEDRATALAAGFAAHVGKPVDPEELLAAVGALVHPPSAPAC